MGRSRTEVLLPLLVGIVLLLLMVALIGLLRMEQLQREVLAPLRPDQRPSGLPPGTKAPSFALPDLSGQPVSLDALAGREVRLVFASPR